MSNETYWNHKGALQATYADILWPLVPAMGECPADRPKLETLRVVSKAYYNLYNDGDIRNVGAVKRHTGYVVEGRDHNYDCDDDYDDDEGYGGGFDVPYGAPEYITPYDFDKTAAELEKVVTAAIDAAYSEHLLAK